MADSHLQAQERGQSNNDPEEKKTQRAMYEHKS
jgi:hypothetical protein